MTDSDLIDQLAERFYQIDYQAMSPHQPWAAYEAKEAYCRLARECLRQMQWAARQEARLGRDSQILVPQTIAPPDWTYDA